MHRGGQEEVSQHTAGTRRSRLIGAVTSVTREDMDQHIRSDRFGVLLGTKTLLSEPPKIQIHTVSQSEGMEAIHAARD